MISFSSFCRQKSIKKLCIHTCLKKFVKNQFPCNFLILDCLCTLRQETLSSTLINTKGSSVKFGYCFHNYNCLLIDKLTCLFTKTKNYSISSCLGSQHLIDCQKQSPIPPVSLAEKEKRHQGLDSQMTIYSLASDVLYYTQKKKQMKEQHNDMSSLLCSVKWSPENFKQFL